MSEESAFSKTTRQGIEGRIMEAFNAHDMTLTDAQLDLWPYGRPRQEISVEAAHHIASQCTPVSRVIPFNNIRRAA